ncbi:unnamed protein product [Triticum turgidum subsp. durum]|uniref:Disease resistance N-terminal domain-containing protein n=1 Tax=Triticum turgidum subsp. durum TaxID=4567 RepID=A0A9R1AYL0_TRITD|nr:unnamed protein product [Triticum turgidum subsp. durum]
MKMTLESVDVVLHDAERESIKHKSMLLWLKQLKDAANDISHMLEDFEDETDLNLIEKTQHHLDAVDLNPPNASSIVRSDREHPPPPDLSTRAVEDWSTGRCGHASPLDEDVGDGAGDF